MEGVRFCDPVPHGPASVVDGMAEDLVAPDQTEAEMPSSQIIPDDAAASMEDPKSMEESVSEAKDASECEDPILPDHYYDAGNIPVFKPTMDQFRDFEKFIKRINEYGMKSGIVKVIPPQEWRDTLPPLDERVKEVRLKNAIEQQFAGSGGVFRQTNIEKRRVYNLPQWRENCESTDHQPPARRGEVRMAGHTVGKRKPKAKKSNLQKLTSPTPARESVPPPASDPSETAEVSSEQPQLPSPEHSSEEDHPPAIEETVSAPVVDAVGAMDVDPPIAQPINRPSSPRSPHTRKRKRVASNDPNSDTDQANTDPDFQNFDYRIYNASEYTVERCKELERIYWKTITFNNPMYGADMPGSLFDDSTVAWNVAKLDNLLCRIGKTIPGVNSAYLYLGMWKATFSWHVEDMDLYSINYIHFGAPKQWYSISQSDAERFEAVMRSFFPNDHKGCHQFMRHKTFLTSPFILESKGIKVNRLVHHEGEFVITFPFGYHSGYNLGYNCAESVNFATEGWLEIGRMARKCNCASDSVTINVDDIVGAIRGNLAEEEMLDIPLTPPESVGVEEAKKKKRDRKRADETERKTAPKKEKRPQAPCVLCPNDPSRISLLPTESGKMAHRICAEYIPETWVTTTEDGREMVVGVEAIEPARWNLKCFYCSSTRGVKFQCSVIQCWRAYHATCAAAAGVLVEIAQDEHGVVSSYQCRFHRPKRAHWSCLEQDQNILDFASKLQPGDMVQGKLGGMENDVPFVGNVVENCRSEQIVVIELANGELFETTYKWILAPPTRDVRALCATQSVPGSTKQRQKKTKKTVNISEAVASNSSSIDSQTAQQPQLGHQQIQNYSPPHMFIPSDVTSSVPPVPEWTKRNPALAQYHQAVWQVQQDDQNPASVGDAFATAMQRIKAVPLTPAPTVQSVPNNPALSIDRPPDIVLPPPEFNLGQPPPTLLPAPSRRELPIAPRPPSVNPPQWQPQNTLSSYPLPHSELIAADSGHGSQWRRPFTSLTAESVGQVHLQPQQPSVQPRPLATIPPPVVPTSPSLPQFQQVRGGFGNSIPWNQNCR